MLLMLYLFIPFCIIDIICYIKYNYKLDKMYDIDNIMLNNQYIRIDNLQKNPIYILTYDIYENLCL